MRDRDHGGWDPVVGKLGTDKFDRVRVQSDELGDLLFG